MEPIKAIVRFFSYLFHGLLALALLAASALALASGMPNLHLGMLPWSGSRLIYVLFFGGLAGLAIVILAMRATLRGLFFLWSLAVAVLLLRGYVLTSYRFAPGEWKTAAWLTGLAWLAVLGAWFQMRRRITARQRY